ncbi:cysteine-rich receptor-like protein kinase 44 [Silene latifolia]|uniref:cysteine-rich receptor-like protein kinase 44 n=1 Tax=Silene latifolia TaxID=37657 RepID=UPI003D76AEC5
MAVRKLPEKVTRVQLDADGKQQFLKEVVEGPQPGQRKYVKKKPENMEVSLGQHPIQVNDVKKEVKEQEQIEDLEQHPWIQVVKKKSKKKERNWNNKAAGKQPQQVFDEQVFSLKKFCYSKVKLMTNNFDYVNVIGKGGFGKVYKGVMNGTPVAVKRLNRSHRRIDDYRNEVEALGRTSHFNLVKLIGYCVEDEHKLLVYEYMKNGPLESWIFGTNPKNTLSWLEKKRIILGIAEGLVYLHENCEKKILHRDLKPANVLLDDNKNAKLCDFGISKLLERDQSSTSTVCCGTRGYLAPEIVKGIRKISEKVDVYSFGIVVLEVVFGKRYYRLVSSNQTNLEASQLPGLIRKLDDEMRKNGKDIERIGELAISCLSDKPEARPSMSDIVGAIKGADAKLGRN